VRDWMRLGGRESPFTTRVMAGKLDPYALRPPSLFSLTYQGAKPGVLGDGEEDAVAVVYDGHVRGDTIDFLKVECRHV